MGKGYISPLAAHRMILRAALSGAHIFAWLFIFQYFYIVTGGTGASLARAALLYALAQVITCLVTPYAASQLRHGIRRAMYIALIAAAFAFIILGAILGGLVSAYLIPSGIVLFAGLIGIYRALYFVPYKVEAAQTGARFPLTVEIMIAIVPAFAGIFLAANGAASVWLLYSAAALILVSALPLMNLRESYEGFSWKYRETFAELISPEYRKLAIRAFLEGAEGAAFLFVWPIAAFLILGWSYSLLGI